MPTSQWGRRCEGRARDRHRAFGGRAEALGVDAVVDLFDALRRKAHAVDQVALQVLRQCHVALHEGRIEPAQALVTRAAAVQVGHVAPVFAVDACGHPRRPGYRLHLQRGEVAGVHDGRAVRAQQLPQPRVQAGALARGFVQRDALDGRVVEAVAKVGYLGQCHHHVAVGAARHVVDEIDDAVLQAAGVEAVEDV